jgi:hypothetical protein
MKKKNMGGVGLFLFQFFFPLTSRQAAGNSVFQILKRKEFLLSCFFWARLAANSQIKEEKKKLRS